METRRFVCVFLIAAVLMLSVSSIACSKQSESQTSNTAKVPASSVVKSGQTSTASAGTVIRLKTISFVDQQGIGSEAFNMLIPADWQYEGGIQWVLDNPGMPAVSQFRVWNPKGTEQFAVYPNQAFFWTDNSGTLQLFPIGSKYFGNEVGPLLNPLDALKQVVLPRFRANVQGLKVVKEEEIPNVVLPSGDASQSTLQTSTKAGKIRIEYSENGKVYEDEIYCTVEATYFPIQGMFGTSTNVMWGVNYISSFRAEKGKLDENAKIFQTVSDSVTLNLKWFNTYVQVIEYLIKMQIQQIQSIGQLGSIIAQTGDEIRQENLDLFNQREAMNDRVSQQFSEYTRGVETYYNPLEDKTVELPSNYDNVWVSPLGEYALSDNPNFNPNIGGNQNFQKLELAKK